MTHNSFAETCRDCYEQIQGFLNGSDPVSTSLKTSHDTLDYQRNRHLHNSPKYLHEQTKDQVRLTLKIYSDALDLYELNELSISYNGGKDCLVMLVIFLAAIYDKYKNDLNNFNNNNTNINNNSNNNDAKSGSFYLNSVYINSEKTFKEQDDFLDESIKTYNLSMVKINDNMKSGFTSYLNMKKNIKAIIVGIRRIDPYAENLNYIQMTDHGWPQFMRINPVLEWTYSEVWYFLKFLNIDYCKLYDEGYTSIGGVDNTIRNPLLKIANTKDQYWPAYMLDKDDKERLSRVVTSKVASGSEKITTNSVLHSENTNNNNYQGIKLDKEKL